MNTTATRKPSAAARLDVLEPKVDRILALLEAQAAAKVADPAPVTPRPRARRTAAPVTPAAPVTLTRAQEKAWNRAIGSLASHGRVAGTHKRLMDRWAEAQGFRAQGLTPAQALTAMGLTETGR